MTTADPIRTAVLAELERREMSRAELARQAAWKPTNLGEWLNGTRDPALSSVTRVLEVLGLRVTKERAKVRSD